MPKPRNMIAALLLLCAMELHCSDEAAAQSKTCIPTHEVVCFVPPDNLNASEPVSVKVSAGMKLNISLGHLSGYSACQWMRGVDAVQTVNETYSILGPFSVTDTGDYTLSCEMSKIVSSITVSLHVVKRPTKPKLTLEKTDETLRSPRFKCISEGYPTPRLEWSGNKNGENSTANNGNAVSDISTSKYHNSGAMCCATNTEGQECSQLYDYDLGTDIRRNEEVSNVTVTAGQPLLLRCRIQGSRAYSVWEKGSEVMDSKTLICSSEANEICIKNDSHYGSKMAYLFIKSVRVDHSDTYTCRSPENKTKSVNIHVQAESFVSATLDETKIVPDKNASMSCLQASVSYEPVLDTCFWEGPDKSITKCSRNNWVLKHSIVKMCQPLISGDYKLHLEAGGKKETKIISVCVAATDAVQMQDTSHFKVNNNITFETVSLVPANLTWMACPLSNDSNCEGSWEEIAFQTDPDVCCSKTIKSSVMLEQANGNRLKFCLKNAVTEWCKIMHDIPVFQLSRGAPDRDDDNSLMVLKLLSLFLLLSLVAVCVVLVYFVKKKKPKYQPQLQIIQMVGPNDNDYIYINFKDFEYDQKWEFPRENLELGTELGSGAFGMVVQATAYGISKPGVSQQVAVKMLKEKHQTVEKEALMSELKMLTHIGHHANIVNLLGACTDSGPIYLIFQYCCYGDLLNYLKKNRERYHKSVTDAFVKDRFSSLYHNLQHKKSNSEIDTYVPMINTATRGQKDIALLNLSSGDTGSFEDLEIYENLDDQTENLQVLTFDDLLSFAFQVAKGMEFLSSKNCIHRDLAARNVLVTKGRQIKIGDFGLARDIDNDSNYVVRGNVRLPVKWMAPESTFQGIYTMKSDVWAYGILLWEIFSLGVTPYPGMKVDHTFYSMIERGFKMDCPYYADETVYGMMCKCWALDPNNRPSFSKLVSFMCDQLMVREEQVDLQIKADVLLLYHNMPNQMSSEYQNTSATIDISALTKQSESKTQLTNDYHRTNVTEESRTEMSDTEAAEEKLLKPSDTE